MDNNKENRLLECEGLKVAFYMEGNKVVNAVNGVSYYVNRNEVVAVVGESGCGKSVTQMSTLQLIVPPGKIVEGNITFDGIQLLKDGKTATDMEKIRGNRISMIFQEPMTSLNPVFTVGKQLTDIIRTHKKMSKKEAWDLATRALDAVGIPDAASRMKNYPFEMSGGMRQRVLIALSVACQTDLIIADEPTTALDVTVQAQVMELLMRIKKEHNSSIIVVTHNLGLVSRYADRIYVMYAGRVIESGTTEEILTDPLHPYTLGLLAAVPKIDDEDQEELVPIDGAPPSLSSLPDYCAFYPRCPYRTDACKNSDIPTLAAKEGTEHYCACHRFADGGLSNGK